MMDMESAVARLYGVPNLLGRIAVVQMLARRK